MNQKRGTIKLKNRTKGREEEEEEVVINGGSTFIFINININIIRRVGHILWLSWSNAKPSFPRSCPIHQKVFNFVFYIFDSLLSLLDSFFYTYIYCFSPPPQQLHCIVFILHAQPWQWWEKGARLLLVNGSSHYGTPIVGSCYFWRTWLCNGGTHYCATAIEH